MLYVSDLDGRLLDVVFGDETNDVSLFRAADESIAVENAVPELKQHASKVIGASHEDSVVKYLMAARS